MTAHEFNPSGKHAICSGGDRPGRSIHSLSVRSGNHWVRSRSRPVSLRSRTVIESASTVPGGRSSSVPQREQYRRRPRLRSCSASHQCPLMAQIHWGSTTPLLSGPMVGIREACTRGMSVTASWTTARRSRATMMRSSSGDEWLFGTRPQETPLPTHHANDGRRTLRCQVRGRPRAKAALGYRPRGGGLHERIQRSCAGAGLRPRHVQTTPQREGASLRSFSRTDSSSLRLRAVGEWLQPNVRPPSNRGRPSRSARLRPRSSCSANRPGW